MFGMISLVLQGDLGPIIHGGRRDGNHERLTARHVYQA